MRAFDWARAGIKTVQLNDRSCSPTIYIYIYIYIYIFFFFQFLMGSVMDINKLYQYITTFNLINITIKNIALNTGRLWRRPVLGQSEIVCTVAILDVQVDTAIIMCRKRSLAFRRGALGRAARAHIVERTSGLAKNDQSLHDFEANSYTVTIPLAL